MSSIRPVALLSTLLLIAGPSPAGPRAPERKVVLFYTGNVGGTLEPCGCTSDPLGDIARVTGVVRRAVQEAGGAVLLLDGGNLTYPVAGLSSKTGEAADLRATFLAEELAKLPWGGSALGEGDLARGSGKVVPRRLAANLPGAPFVEPGRVHLVGSVKIGVLGVTTAAVGQLAGLAIEDPVKVATRENLRLRQEGAELVIALAAMNRAQARQLARSSGVDFVILGQDEDGGLPQADRAGNAYLVAAAAEFQKVGRIDLVLRGPAGAQHGELTDAGGPDQAQRRQEEIARDLATLDADLARWAREGGADQNFVARKTKERDDLKTEAAHLAAGPWHPPATGSYFTNRLIPMSRVLPADAVLTRSLKRLNEAVGVVNLRAATPPPPAQPGRAAFVGDRACGGCHKGAMAYWKTTVHAHAWKTLVDGKNADYACVGCHVTGYGEVGGPAWDSPAVWSRCSVSSAMARDRCTWQPRAWKNRPAW